MSPVKATGASEVVAAPGDADAHFDLILDSVGSTLSDAIGCVAPDGTVVMFGNSSGEPTPVRMVTVAPSGAAFALLSLVLPGPRVRLFTLLIRRRRDDLETLARYVDRGELRPVVERVYPLAEIADAHRAVESGHARGKRLIRVLSDGAASRADRAEPEVPLAARQR